MTFLFLKKQKGVGASWTWDMTMRSIINDDRYKVIPTLGQKKQIWQEYLGEKRKEDRVWHFQLLIALFSFVC
jgi:pre-mRNA-processing factor 40